MKKDFVKVPTKGKVFPVEGDDEETTAKLSEMGQYTIEQKTRNNYVSYVNGLLTHCGLSKMEEITKKHYVDYVHERSREGRENSNYFSQLRAAVVFFQSVRLIRGDWASGDDVSKASVGAGRKFGKVKRERGQIEEGDFQTLHEEVKTLLPKAEDMLLVVRGTGLRKCSIELLLPEDITIEDSGQMIVTAYQKNATARNKKKSYGPQTVVDPMAKKILSERKERTRPGNLIFPVKECKTDDLGKIVSQTARKFNWSSKLDWTGIHNLRHSAMFKLGRTCGSDDALADAASGCSRKNRRKYSRTNSQRLEEIEERQAKKARRE